MKKSLLLAGVACLLSVQANASEIKPYVGFDIGGAKADYGYWLDGEDDTFVVSNFNIGAKFNKYFGVEFSTQASSEVDIEGMGDLSYSSVNADVIAYAPVNDKVDLFGLAGVGYYTLDLDMGENLFQDCDTHIQNQEVAFRIGGGIQYNINEKWAMRGAVRHAFIDNDYVESLTEFTLGVRYNF